MRLVKMRGVVILKAMEANDMSGVAPNPPPQIPASPTEEKQRLEAEKLKAEIEVIRRPYYQVPTFYTALTPVLLACLGVIFTWASGWFDVQRTRISNEKIQLQIDTERLTDKQKSQEVRLQILETELRSLRGERIALTNQIAALERDRDEIRAAKESFEKEATRLAGSDTNATLLLRQLGASQTAKAILEEDVNKLKGRQKFLAESHAIRVNQIKDQIGGFSQQANPSPQQKQEFYGNLLTDLAQLNLLYGHILLSTESTNIWLPSPVGLKVMSVTPP